MKELAGEQSHIRHSIPESLPATRWYRKIHDSCKTRRRHYQEKCLRSDNRDPNLHISSTDETRDKYSFNYKGLRQNQYNTNCWWNVALKSPAKVCQPHWYFRKVTTSKQNIEEISGRAMIRWISPFWIDPGVCNEYLSDRMDWRNPSAIPKQKNGYIGCARGWFMGR